MSSNLPKAVQDQIDRANQAQQSLSANTEQQDQLSAHVDDSKQGEQEKQQQVTNQQPDNRENDVDYWKNRYNVLQGKYNKEVPALSSKIREQQTRIEELEKRPEQNGSYLSDEEKEEYGDVAHMMERVAKQAADDATKQVRETAAQTSQTLYYKDLDSLATDWRVKNVDDGFNDWLDEIDPISGYQRRDLLMDAFSSRDVERTASIFNAYTDLNTSKASTPANNQEPPFLPKSHSGNGDQAPTTNQGRRFTRAEIKAFYDDKARGVYRGREQEADAIEREIFASS